jgi:hypothetical protein
MSTNDAAPDKSSGARLSRTSAEDTDHYTTHIEPHDQGGQRFARCRHCGAESVHGADDVLHDPTCQLRR